jgi:hypothetical protein
VDSLTELIFSQPSDGTPFCWDLSLVNEVFSHPNVVVARSIARGALRQIALCFSELMHDIVTHPQDVASYVRLFLFPRAVLKPVPWAILKKYKRKRRGVEKRRFTLSCLKASRDGGDSRDALIREVLRLPATRICPPDSQSALLRRYERLMRQDGQYSKAIQALKKKP